MILRLPRSHRAVTGSDERAVIPTSQCVCLYKRVDVKSVPQVWKEADLAEICVTLARQRHRMLLAEMKAAVKANVKMIEVRLDYLNRDPRVKQILTYRRCPMVATARRQQDGGKWASSEERRLQLLRSAIVEGFDYVDLELDVADKIPRYGDTKRIISYHDMNGMPENLKDLYGELSSRDADIVKIAVRATSPNDNFKMFEIIENADVPAIGICMGEYGTASRVLGPRFGSPFTYAAFSKGRTVAPGLLTFEEMRDLYYFEEIDDETDVYAVIGDPIAQSLSPLVHNHAFRACSLNKVYVPFKVPESNLKEFIGHCAKIPIRGLSVTIPHKKAILEFGEQGDDLTKKSECANTMVWGREGGYTLYNTDGPAAVNALNEALQGDDRVENPLEGRKVMLLGAGGVASTLAHALVAEGAMVTITARRPEPARDLAHEVGCTMTPWDERYTDYHDVVVNCTPLGMYPDQLDESPFDEASFREGMVVFDTVYNPENTLFLNTAKSRGCKIVTGVTMFVGQAETQFEHFTHTEAPTDQMSRLVREQLSPAQNMLREERKKEEADEQRGGDGE